MTIRGTDSVGGSGAGGVGPRKEDVASKGAEAKSGAPANFESTLAPVDANQLATATDRLLAIEALDYEALATIPQQILIETIQQASDQRKVDMPRQQRIQTRHAFAVAMYRKSQIGLPVQPVDPVAGTGDRDAQPDWQRPDEEEPPDAGQNVDTTI